MTALRRRGCPAWLESFAWLCAVAAGFGIGTLRERYVREIEARDRFRRLEVATEIASGRCTDAAIGIGRAVIEYKGGRLD